MAVINAFNHVLCAPSSNDLLNKFQSGIHISSANSFRKKGCHLSGPWDLFAFKVFSIFHTRSDFLSNPNPNKVARLNCRTPFHNIGFIYFCLSIKNMNIMFRKTFTSSNHKKSIYLFSILPS